MYLFLFSMLDVLLSMGPVGICGSDLKYWTTGKCGRFTVESPMVMGHEAAGTVVKLGPNVKYLKIGKQILFYRFTKQTPLLTTLKKRAFENILGKGENASKQHFLLFPQCFLTFQEQISHLFCGLVVL